MRVCVITSVHPPFDVRIFHKECRSLVEASHSVTLVAPHTERGTVDGIEIDPLPVSSGLWSRVARSFWHGPRRALATGCEVCHIHDPELIPAGVALKLLGRRVVYDVHEDYRVSARFKPYLPAWSRGLVASALGVAEWVADRLFDATVCATPAIHRHFERTRSRSVVVENFPLRSEFLSRSLPDWSERERIVSYVGVISERRGAFEMLSALVRAQERTDVTLHLAGDVRPTALRDELRSHPGWRHVVDHGVLDRAGVAALLRRSRAGFVLIHPDRQYSEAYPVKMFEYMASGVPVVATDVPLWRGILEESGAGLVVDPFDADAVSDAIVGLMKDDRLASEMSTRGRAAVDERFTWDGPSRRLLQLYDELSALERGPDGRSAST